MKEFIDIYCSNDNDNNKINALNEIILNICKYDNKADGFMKILENSSEYLINNNENIREQCINLLAELLYRLPTLPLNSEALSVLIKFFSNKIKDDYNVSGESIYALVALMKFHNNWQKIDIARVLTTIFDHLTIQTLSQKYRQYAFILFYGLCEKYSKDIINLGRIFVQGIIQAVDGERDPRNLIICFSIIEFTIRAFNMDIDDELIEELFDITSCYFPITFQASKNNPYNVTREQLIQKLRAVFISTSRFAPNMFSLLIEKLEAADEQVKLDVFETLSICINAYERNDILPFLAVLKGRLFDELYTLQDETLKKAGLKCIQSLAKKFDGNNELFLQPLLNECMEELEVPDSARAKLSIVLLQVAISISISAAQNVWQTIHKHIETVFHEQQLTPTQRQTWTYHLLQIVLVTPKDILKDYVENVVGMLGSGISQGYPQMRAWSLEGLTHLGTLDLLNNEEINMWIITPCVNILCTHDDRILLKSAHECILKISSKYNELILTHATPILLKNIFNIKNDNISLHRENDLMNIILALSETLGLNLFNQYFEHFIISLNNISSSSSYLLFYIQSLYNILNQLKIVSSTHILADIVYVASTNQFIYNDINIIQQIRHLLNALVGFSDNNMQLEYINWCSDILLSNNTHKLLQACKLISNVSKNVNINETLIFTIICSVTQPPSNIFSKLWQILVDSISQDMNSIHMVTSEALATIINKSDPILELSNDITNQLFSSTHTAFIITIGWFCKAYLMRSHPIAKDLHQHLLKLLQNNDEIIRNAAINALSIVVNHTNGFGGLTNTLGGCKGYFLYTQRCFVYCLPQYLELFRQQDSKSPARAALLLVLTQLITNVPQSTLLESLDSFLPLMIEALGSQHQQVKLSALRTLASLIRGISSVEFLSNHINVVFRRLFELSCPPTPPSCRLIAIWCIDQCSVLPYHILYPLRIEILKHLKLCLDDNKRAVRKLAQKTSNTYSVLGAE